VDRLAVVRVCANRRGVLVSVPRRGPIAEERAAVVRLFRDEEQVVGVLAVRAGEPGQVTVLQVDADANRAVVGHADRAMRRSGKGKQRTGNEKTPKRRGEHGRLLRCEEAERTPVALRIFVAPVRVQVKTRKETLRYVFPSDLPIKRTGMYDVLTS